MKFGKSDGRHRGVYSMGKKIINARGKNLGVTIMHNVI